jgi:hypothetical protein
MITPQIDNDVLILTEFYGKVIPGLNFAPEFGVQALIKRRVENYSKRFSPAGMATDKRFSAGASGQCQRGL